jgi:two-component SAPR family response regulator
LLYSYLIIFIDSLSQTDVFPIMTKSINYSNFYNAKGYILKPIDTDELMDAIDRIKLDMNPSKKVELESVTTQPLIMKDWF